MRPFLLFPILQPLQENLHGRSYFQLCLTPPEIEPPAE